MTMVEFFVLIVLVALAAAFLVLLMNKLGFVEWMQVHGDRILSQMFSCMFCLSFWTCTALMCVLACWYDEPMLFFCGTLSAPITRRLV